MLSGGFDSRVLLAILLAEDKNYWQVSTFGEAGEADNRISKKLINELALPAEYHPFDDTTTAP
jgi:7-cyano-7-deazaguanine synthase in queuosine biosynthesis